MEWVFLGSDISAAGCLVSCIAWHCLVLISYFRRLNKINYKVSQVKLSDEALLLKNTTINALIMSNGTIRRRRRYQIDCATRPQSSFQDIQYRCYRCITAEEVTSKE